MALKIDNILIEPRYDDGTFERKNIQINNEDTQPTLINDGDMLVWERGNGYSYDVFDSSIDTTKWTANVTGDYTKSETGTTIGTAINTASTTGDGTAQLDAILLPALEDMTELQFRAELHSVTNNSNGELKILGLSVASWTAESGYLEDSVWTATKNPDSTWTIKNDGTIVDSNWNATNNKIETSMSWTLGAGFIVNAHILIYNVTVGGQTYLLIKSTQRTFAINLASF